MKNMAIKQLFIYSFSCLFLLLYGCTDTDDLRADVDALKKRIVALDKSTEQFNTSIESLSYMLSEKRIVGVTSVDKGYRVEFSDGQSFELISDEAKEALFPRIGINADGNWIYSTDNGQHYTLLTAADGKPISAYPTGADNAPIKSPRMRISADGYWQVSYDGGTTYTDLLNGGQRIPAFPSAGTSTASVFSSVYYDAVKQILSVTLAADGKHIELPVVNTFFLNIKGVAEEQVFPLGELRCYEVEQSEVSEAMIQAPEGWEVKLTENELRIQAPRKTDAERRESIRIVITSPKNFIRIVKVDVKLLSAGFYENACAAWNEFANKQPGNVLLDFSYAGYKHGEVAPPDVSTLNYKVYDITQYGAIPNDGVSDREAFIKVLEAMGAKRGKDADAIRYQMGSANAIIYFPEGEFILQGAGESNMPLRLTMNNLVIKGAGRDKTTIRMAVENTLTDPAKLWSSPVMMEIKHNSGLTDLTDVTGDAAKGSFSVEVASTAGISAGDWVCLHLKNTDPVLIRKELLPYTPQAYMTNLHNVGVQVYDYHQVKSVSGNVVTFVEPIMHEVDPQWGWKIQKYPHYENIGVEDLAFEGNAKPEFVHHGSGADDGGYKLIDFVRLTNSWMRRVDFRSVSEASSITNCANVSVYDVRISGNRGHSAIRSQASSRVFIGKVVDESDGYDCNNGLKVGTTYIKGAGQYHACGVSKQSMGTVIWNVKWGKDACFEAHATQPRATLIDRCSGGFMPWRQGGDKDQVPNHLADLTVWNMNADVVNYDNSWGGKFIWWSNNSYWWKILPPVVVGFHGQPVIFDTTQMIRNESQGQAVTPYSLYEAQLRVRLGYVPAWLNSIK